MNRIDKPVTARNRAGELYRRGAGMLAALLLGMAQANAATIQLTGRGGGAGGYGNSLGFSGGGISLQAFAFAETGSEAPAGSGFYLFQTAEVYSWSTGIGICNRNEGLANSGCDSTEHEVDTVGRDDLLVLLFDRRVSFQSLTVDPWDSQGSDPNDRDIIFRVGDLPALPDLSAYTFNTLGNIAGVGAETHRAAPSGFNALTHALSGTGNALFLSGNYRIRGCYAGDIGDDRECEAYKIAGITVAPALPPQQVVPVPAAAWLLASALGVLYGARRRAHLTS